MQVSVASSPTCPSQLAPIGQTSIICTKLTNAQVGCVTNVDSYRLYACTYVAGVRDISKIVCYHQVLFSAVTKLQQYEEKTTCFSVSQNCKYPRMLYCAFALLRICTYVAGKLPIYTVYSHFKPYVGLFNLPHSSTCPMFP